MMITPSERLAELFGEISPLPPGERTRRLEDIAAQEPELVDDLKALLAAHDTAGDFMQQLDTGCASVLLVDDDRWSRPAMAGPFRLGQEIGRGGLGVVYLGERTGGEFEQRVAVKLIKRGMDSDQIVRRFRAERRILATLEHPNISRLIDGGVLEDGRPWFAMEYIDGQPLTTWCRQCKPTLDQRLRLFEQVCATVHYAHARLIVHRDLKPANILVSGAEKPDPPVAGPGTGSAIHGQPEKRHGVPRRSVKLLDFGIAKLLDQDEGGTELTGAGLLAMSRDYAAPEQIRGEPVSTATDVHALGVVLYELLTGVHPYRRSGQSREELARAICETEPDRPSDVASRRQTDLPARRLRGDLDAIVLTAMAKRPERRYASAEALAEDLKRHRSKLPIRARQRSRWYRTARFARRHRMGLAATAAVMLALVAGLVAATWQARRAGEQARLARNLAAQAEQAAQRSQRSLDFLTELFRSADPIHGTPVSSIEQVLDIGAKRARETLGSDPKLQAQILLRLAEVRYNRAEYPLAGDLADDALKQIKPEWREQLAQANLLAGSARYHRNRCDQAESWLRRAAALYDALGDADSSAEARSNLAGCLRQTGDYKQAVALQQQVLTDTEARLGPDAPRTLEQRFALAVFATDLGNYKLAEHELRSAIRGIEHSHPDMRVALGASVLRLASVLDRVGQSEEAGRLFKRGIAIHNELYGSDSAAVAAARFSYGTYLLGQQHPGRAEAEFRAVINAAGAEPATRAHGLRYLGRALRDQGRLTDAIVQLKAAEKAYRSIGGTSMLEQAHRAAADRGRALALSGRLKAAIPVLKSAVAGIEAIRGKSHYDLIKPLGYLGEALAKSGDPAAADTLERAAKMSEAVLGPDHPFTVEAKSRRKKLDL